MGASCHSQRSSLHPQRRVWLWLFPVLMLADSSCSMVWDAAVPYHRGQFRQNEFWEHMGWQHSGLRCFVAKGWICWRAPWFVAESNGKKWNSCGGGNHSKLNLPKWTKWTNAKARDMDGHGVHAWGMVIIMWLSCRLCFWDLSSMHIKEFEITELEVWAGPSGPNGNHFMKTKAHKRKPKTIKTTKHRCNFCALTAWYWTLPCALNLLTTVHLKTFDHCIRLYPVGLFLVCDSSTSKTRKKWKRAIGVGEQLYYQGWVIGALFALRSMSLNTVPGDGLVMGHEPCERHFPPQFVTPLALRPGCSFLLRGAGFPMELNGPMGLFNGHHWVFRVRVF